MPPLPGQPIIPISIHPEVHGSAVHAALTGDQIIQFLQALMTAEPQIQADVTNILNIFATKSRGQATPGV